MSNISDPFIKRPIATSLFMIAILLIGILAYNLIPVSALPEVEYPTIQVSTFYPGASPEVIASSITAPLEKQFGQMPGLKQMTSSSANGTSLITLQFNLKMSLDLAEQQVQASINTSSNLLPADIPNPPVYNKVNPADTPILTLALTSKYLPLTQVEDLAETRFAPKISEIPGVGLVSINGGQRPAVRVQVNPQALASNGLNLEDIRTAITTSNVNIAKGNFDGPRLAYTINANDQLLTSNSYQKLIVTYKNGAPIYLNDIANIKDGSENNRQAAWMNLNPAIILNIQKQPNSNVISVVDNIKEMLPKLKSTLPSSIEVDILNDRTVTIRNSVKDAKFELILAIVLVVLVIFIFLNNLPATFIPSIAVPLSLIGTFAVMYGLGYSLNNLTIMALIIATGFVVDDAIVMIENIARYIEEGETPLNAALKGSSQIGFTILSLTISLIAVLIPLLFMNDIIGRLFREFAVTLSVSILISAIISLTLTPMLCRYLLRQKNLKKKGKITLVLENFIDKIIYHYSITLKIVLNHQKTTITVAIFTLIFTIYLFYTIPKGFFPVQDTGLIQGITEAPQSISFNEMYKKQQEITAEILKDPAVENISSFIGVDGTNFTLNSGRVLIRLKPIEERLIHASKIIKRIQKNVSRIAGITIYMQPVQDINIDDRVSRTQYQFSINSPYFSEVEKWSTLLVNKLKSSNQLKDVANDIQNFGLESKININRNAASRFGISTAMIDSTLYDAFGQRQVSTMFSQTNQYHVILEVNPELKISPQNILDSLFIQSTNGTAIPFSSFTNLSQNLVPLVINRQGQFPVSTISFNVEQNKSLGDAVNDIEKAKNDLGFPESIQTNFEGAAKSFQNSLDNEGFLIIAAIIVVYIVLGILYESYIHPITILSTLPSAGMGALLALQLSNCDFDIIGLIGIVLLIGIVKKNAIMIIDFALEMERVEKKSPQDAIFQACLLRFRPILMTTLASLLSAIPLTFGNGMGSELRRPLGIAIIGGLAVSQLLTLYTTPVIYLLFDKLSRYVNSLFKNKIAKSNTVKDAE